jgi:hypothetical protein
MALRSSWPALLLAPLVALAQVSFAPALVTPSCIAHSLAAQHALAAACLAVALACTALAVAQRRHLERERADGAPAPPHGESDAHAHRAWIMARVALGSGVLSCAVVVALWIPVWLLSPCVS